ncbi:MAG: M48 family metallopeptidase [Trueperaceae bacterium]|nr:M48 family metallopeptidase [Trueperaceae bacterium]
MTASALLALLVAVLLADFGLTWVARWLQLRHQPATPPEELAGVVDAAAYARGRDYAAAKARLGFAEALVTLALWLTLIASGALAAAHGALADVTSAGWWATLLFLGGVALAFDLVGLPFALARTFGIEARFGFNTTTVATFMRDRLTGYALALVLGGGLLALLLASIEAWGATFWLPYAALATVVMVLLAAFQTSVLLPLFNKLTPLPDGELGRAIADYVRGAGFELENTYVMDGSKRSTKANAFFSGLGRQKKVVLFDTLIERHPPEEVVAVVAHEVGHARLRHLPWLLLGNVASVTLMLFLLSLVVDSAALSRALGADGQVLALNLLAFGLLFTPVTTAIGALLNALSRRFEYQADAFAASSHVPAAMMSALRRLSHDALADPTAHPLYAWLFLTHPAPVDRIRAIAASAAEPTASAHDAAPA